MRTGISPFKSHALGGSACLVIQNYFHSHKHLIFRAAAQNPVAITHTEFFLHVHFLKEDTLPSFSSEGAICIQVPAKITLLFSHASVFRSLQKPILSTSAYFMSPMFFSYMSVSQETPISHRKHCSYSYFPDPLIFM